MYIGLKKILMACKSLFYYWFPSRFCFLQLYRFKKLHFVNYSTHSTFWTINGLYILWMLTVWNCHIITKVLLWYSTMYFYFPSLKLLNCLGIDKHWFNFMQQYNSLDSWMLRWINPLSRKINHIELNNFSVYFW